MQKFMAEGCREALLEEKRRFCFLVDKHCMFSYHITAFHDKVSTGTGVPHGDGGWFGCGGLRKTICYFLGAMIGKK